MGKMRYKINFIISKCLNMNNAKLHDCDEIIMHKDGILTEAGASNLFFIKVRLFVHHLCLTTSCQV